MAPIRHELRPHADGRAGVDSHTCPQAANIRLDPTGEMRKIVSVTNARASGRAFCFSDRTACADKAAKRKTDWRSEEKPAAGNVVFAAGASDYDRSWVEEARRDLARFADRYQ